MRPIELPKGILPGTPEAVAYIESQIPPVYNETLNAPAPEPAAVVANVVAAPSAYSLIIDGLEQVLDGFRELQNA